MDVPRLVRTVRRRAGLSQRAFAAAAGISRSTVADAERGTRLPSLAVIQRMLTIAELTLSLAPTDAPPPEEAERALRRYLRRPLTQRLRLALDESPYALTQGPVWRELAALSRVGDVLLQPPLAYRLWLPDGPATPVRVVLHRPHSAVPATDAVQVDVVDEPRPPRAVSVALQPPQQVWVPTPDELPVDDVAARLRSAAALLHDEAARDDGGRRRPPHRDPQDRAEYERVTHTKSIPDPYVGSPTRSRAWRIGGAASLAQHVRRAGDGRLSA